jgi:hypothetical protein
MAAYAETYDAKARIGRLSRGIGERNTVTDADLERFLEDASAAVDAALGARGLAVPVTDGVATASLRAPVAVKGALEALRALFPAGDGPAAAVELIRSLEADWKVFVDGVVAGTAPVVVILEFDPEAPGLDAGEFWTNEPTYGLVPETEETVNPWLAPEAFRGMRF